MMDYLNNFVKTNQYLSFEKKIKFFSLNIKNIFNKTLFKFLFVFGLVFCISINCFSKEGKENLKNCIDFPEECNGGGGGGYTIPTCPFNDEWYQYSDKEFEVANCKVGHDISSTSGFCGTYDTSGTQDEFGIVGLLKKSDSDSFYPVSISCTNRDGISNSDLFLYYKGSGNIYRNMSDSYYQTLKDKYKKRKAGEYINKRSENTANEKKDFYKSYHCKSKRKKLDAIDFYGVTEYLDHGFISEDVRILCWTSNIGSEFSSYVHGVQALGSNKKFNCTNGYRVNNSNSDCISETTTLTLNKHGGSGGTDRVTATYGSSMTSITPPTRTGYNFGGYYWNSNCAGTQYYSSSGSSVHNWDKEDISTSLEACWRPKTTTITLNKQGGTGGTDSVIATFGSSMPSITLPTRTGYNFTGYRWSTNPTSNLYYSSNGSSYRNWDNEAKTDTLYAHWQVKTITCPSGTYLSANLENCTPCKNGSYCVGGNYTFSSFDIGITTCPSGYDTSARNREKIGDCQIVCNGNYYVPQYGKCTSCPSGYHSSGVRLWYGDSSTCSKINYTITYDWNGGTANSSEKTQNIRFEEYLPNVTLPTKSGYRFKSYNYTYNGNNYKLYYEGNRNKAYINSNLHNDYKWNIPFGVTLKADWELASCQQNQYLSGNSCYNCPSPYAKSEAGTNTKNKCYADNMLGKYIEGSSIKQCDAGHYCPDNVLYYGQTGMKSCDQKYPNALPGSKLLTDCHAFIAWGIYRKFKGTSGYDFDDLKCEEGYYCPGGTKHSYSDNHTIGETFNLNKCPDEYPYSKKENRNIDDCYKKETNITNCNIFEGGITKGGEDKSECRSCKPGYDLSEDGKSCSLKNNLSCPAGEYLKAGEDTCSPCEEGHYCIGFNNHTYNGNKYGIEECPEGYRSNQAKGLISIESCQIKCERDTYLKNTYDRSCTPCDITFGSELNYVNYGNTSSCTAYPITCIPGTYRPANQNSCSPCEEGSYCEGGSFIYDKNNNQGIKECPEGYVDGGIGLKSENECIKKCGIGSTGGKTKQGIDIEYEDPIESQVNYDNKCRYNKCSVKVGNRRVKGFIDNGECKIQCDPGYRMNNGTCEICNIAHATKYRSDGILECEVEECEEGYHATINGCEISKRECKKENIKKGYEYYREGIWGICEIEECNNGYHEEEGRCVLNKRSCEVINGIGEEEYDMVKKEWKRCKATRCNPGYTNDVYKKNGGDINDCGECKNRYERNGEIAVISYIQECEIASCVNEGSLYRLNDRRDRCEIICIEGEDESGRIYWDSITNRCEIECNDSYIMW